MQKAKNLNKQNNMSNTSRNFKNKYLFLKLSQKMLLVMEIVFLELLQIK
jgi:hypothetical protein